MTPFITSRTSTVRLLPPGLAGGIRAVTCAHSSHSDIATGCGRNVCDSAASTSVTLPRSYSSVNSILKNNLDRRWPAMPADRPAIAHEKRRARVVDEHALASDVALGRRQPTPQRRGRDRRNP
jgi:hypothetical protein